MHRVVVSRAQLYGSLPSSFSSRVCHSSVQVGRIWTASPCYKFTDSQAPVKELSSKRREKVDEPKVFEDALNYCSEMVKQRDYENYLAALLMPKAARPRIITILALNAEVSVIRQKIKRNSGVTGIYQLQFWKDALETVAGQKPGPVPKQPVVKALQAFADVASDLELYLKLVSARQQTLGDRPFPCVSDLEANCEQIFGSLILLIMNALNTSSNGSRPSDNDTCRKAASSLGKSLGILTLLRATIPLLKEGVVLLPNDLLVLHGLSPDTVYKNKNPDGLKNLTKDLCMVASKYRQDARVAKDVPKELRFALLPSAVRVDHLLNTLTNNGFNLFDARLQQRHPLLSWKLWWGSFRGYN